MTSDDKLTQSSLFSRDSEESEGASEDGDSEEDLDDEGMQHKSMLTQSYIMRIQYSACFFITQTVMALPG